MAWLIPFGDHGTKLGTADPRCTGARQIATGLNALARRNGKVSHLVLPSAMVSRCVDGGSSDRFLSLPCALALGWVQQPCSLQSDSDEWESNYPLDSLRHLANSQRKSSACGSSYRPCDVVSVCLYTKYAHLDPCCQRVQATMQWSLRTPTVQE